MPSNPVNPFDGWDALNQQMHQQNFHQQMGGLLGSLFGSEPEPKPKFTTPRVISITVEDVKKLAT